MLNLISFSSKMEEYSTHNVGCGGVIINENNEILLVQEHGGFRRGQWNIPSGRLDLGESLPQAAVREIREETGLIC
jgi:ADP-ribose pyrophosphatase YjhB (NUDIX family)